MTLKITFNYVHYVKILAGFLVHDVSFLELSLHFWNIWAIYFWTDFIQTISLY